MDLQATKLELIQKILETQEVDIISKIKELLSTPVAYDDLHNQFEPMSVAEYQSRLEKSFKDLDEGRTTSHKDFMEKIKGWKEG